MKKIILILAMFVVLFVLKSNAQNFKEIHPDSFPKINHQNIKFADFDADGFLDILSTRRVNGKLELSITKNDSLKFKFIGSVIPACDSMFYEVSDINNDGLVDIVVNAHWKDSISEFSVYLNDKNFKFLRKYKSQISLIGEIIVADFNNDGKKDIFTNASLIHKDPGVPYYSALFMNKESFDPINTQIPLLRNGKIELGDFDKNGRLDIIAAGLSEKNIFVKSIFYQTLEGFREDAIPGSFTSCSSIAVGFIDDDGILDFIFSGKDSFGKNFTQAYLKEGQLKSEIKSALLLQVLSAKIADFDHDGVSDILMGGLNKNNLSESGIYYGNNKSYIKVSSDTLSNTGFETNAADLNNDGNLDLFENTQQGIALNRVLINTKEKNLYPNFPSNLFSIRINDLTFFSWDKEGDDKTNPSNISFDIAISKGFNTSEVVSANHSNNTVKKMIRQYGMNYNQDAVCIKNLPNEPLYWSAIAIDNSFESYRPRILPGGFCSGVGGSLNSLCKIKNYDTLYRKETKLHLVSPTGKKVIWYTKQLGIIAKDISIDYLVKGNDVLYSLQLSEKLCSESYVFNIRFESEKNPTDPEIVSDKVVFIPELFSPNSDGNNDFFKVYGKDIKTLTLTIVDRNGSKLFESNDTEGIVNTGWDGKYNGKNQPAGVYFWNISGKNSKGDNLTMNGSTKGIIRLIN